MRCPSCSTLIPDGSRFCGECGSDANATSAPTQTGVDDSRTPQSFPSLDDARFLPGAMVEGRYRIIGLLGQGGMGEVYRADDLKLGQPVALKFLPAALSQDQGRLSRFLHEVKIARQVSHPNVCRVYDVGEADGHHYLSMEYVDGEDLSTLLRRIGRLPEDKAVQIARQLCAGLGAAHELGILHRDIKPANVMLDGRGRAKLTDFGLAGLAESFQGAEVRAGTPTYMAPEQIAGKEVSVKSDVYALGLVLYELFTGKPAFDAGSVVELTRKQLETTPTSLSSVVSGLDPAVERVILQCLDKDPAHRPPTALAVAAALPGGDPLAAALAAGETPSPEMVAAAGPQGGLKPWVATVCLVAVMLAWVLTVIPAKSINPIYHVPMRKSYAALKENAREIAGRLGYDAAPGYSWAGFGFDLPEYNFLRTEHGATAIAEHLGHAGQSVFWMDYRQDAGPIFSRALNGRVSWDSPPPDSGEVSMELDLLGRLNVLRVTPGRKDAPDPQDPVAEVDWASVFELAGLDLEQFESATPTVRPFGFADARLAWTGTLADNNDRAVRVEAASLDGKPVFFSKVISSDALWTSPDDEPAPQAAAGSSVGKAVTVGGLGLLAAAALLLVGGALFLVVRNLKLGRGDRNGAFRVAAFVFAMRSLHWGFAGDHVGHPVELAPFFMTICGATMLALMTWILYVACEPYVRRLWPEALVSWTRVLAARWRDPLVGRDLLIGLTVGAVQTLATYAAFWAGARIGSIGVIPMTQYLIPLRGGRFAVGELFSAFLVATAASLGLMMLFLLLRLVLRKTWLAAALFCLIFGAAGGVQFLALFDARAGMIGFVVQAIVFASIVVVLLRFGLLALVGTLAYGGLSNLSLLTFDSSAPYFSLGLFVTAVAFALALYAWWVSLAGRSLMQDSLLET